MRVIKNAKYLGSVGIDPVIPPRSNRNYLRPCDWFVYKERYLIECFFNKIKPYEGCSHVMKNGPKLHRIFTICLRTDLAEVNINRTHCLHFILMRNGLLPNVFML